MPRKSKSPAATHRPLSGPQRLNKILAAAGLGSRRQVEQLITDGRIEVDGSPVTDLATKVDPETAKLTFDGSAIRVFRPVYYALNKPVGVLSTNSDPSGRMRAIDLVNVKERIFSAGRLDRSSEGLMLLTNDGELVQRLCHPRYGIQKLYLATVQGEVTQVDLEKLVRGVHLAEGYAKVDAVKLRKQRSGAAELEIALSEGKNREIRRILARLGHKVVALKRLAIGPLRLGQLPAGGWRPLTRNEIQALYEAAIAGRRKRRGSSKQATDKTSDARGASRKVAKTNTSTPTLSAGKFDSFFDDYDDDESSLMDDANNSISDSDDIVPVLSSDHSIVGTVISYDDEEPTQESERPSRSNRPRQPRSESSRPPRKTGYGNRSARPSGRASSPNDLRNRQPRGSAKKTSSRPKTTDRPAGPPKANRSGAPKKSFKSSPSRFGKAGPKSAPKRGPKKRGKR